MSPNRPEARPQPRSTRRTTRARRQIPARPDAIPVRRRAPVRWPRLCAGATLGGMDVTRRSLLAGGLAAALWVSARGAFAIGPGSKFRFGQLQLGARRDVPRPTALRRMAWGVE